MRMETGVAQCGDDWPGVFIRGDCALMAYAPAVAFAAQSLRKVNPIEAAILSDMHTLLTSCAVGGPSEIQRIAMTPTPAADPSRGQTEAKPEEDDV